MQTIFTKIKVAEKEKQIIAKGHRVTDERVLKSVCPAEWLWSFEYEGKKFRIVKKNTGQETDKIYLPGYNGHHAYPSVKDGKNCWKVEYKTLSDIHLDDYFDIDVKIVFNIEKMETYY